MWFLVNYIQDLRRFVEVYTSFFCAAIVPPTIDQQILPKKIYLKNKWCNNPTLNIMEI